ncbi:MAG: aldo/keto reductase [Gammaproteobacteria bacterium]|nr:aldo/keto reductase [Gammaproteobacteria bacterium]HXK56512.1 aldo/keto reductase [Gammaproteobacteria bacterium]
MKLALGTAQFGLDYGVSNKSGKVPYDEVESIVELALSNGVDLFDTAPAYGDSEQVLGTCLREDTGAVVTKTSRIESASIDRKSVELVEQSFYQSLRRLKRHSIYAVMIHNPVDLVKPGIEHLIDLLLELKAAGKISRVGASLYTPEQLDLVLKEFPIDLVQVPVNLLDQRLLRGGQLARCRKRNVEVHARSIFLQGFLLAEFDSLPIWFEPYRKTHVAVRKFTKQCGLTPMETAIAFISSLNVIDYAVCGVANIHQFRALLKTVERIQSTELDKIDFSKIACDDENLISPNRWKELRERQ